MPYSELNWTEVRPLPSLSGSWWNALAMDSDGSHLIAGLWDEPGRLYISANSGASWDEIKPAGDWEFIDYGSWDLAAMSADGSCIIVGGSDLTVDWVQRLYISTDGGASWDETQPDGDRDGDWYNAAISADGTHIVVSEAGGDIWTSPDYGANWTKREPYGFSQSGYYYALAISSDGTHIIAGNGSAGSGGWLFISHNFGTNWDRIQPTGSVDGYWISGTVNSDGSKFFVVEMLRSEPGTGKAFISTDGGTNWSETQPAGNTTKNWIACSSSSDGSKLLAMFTGAVGKMFFSINGGTSWDEIQPLGRTTGYWWTGAISLDGTSLFVTEGDKLYLYLPPTSNQPLIIVNNPHFIS